LDKKQQQDNMQLSPAARAMRERLYTHEFYAEKALWIQKPRSFGKP
jgi:hypothetical protein